MSADQTRAAADGQPSASRIDVPPTDPSADDVRPATRRRRRLPVLVELLLALAAVALVQAFIVKPFGVPSQSMEQTLEIGDRIVVNRLDSTVSRGDVVVFGHGDTWQDARRSPASDLFRKAVRTVGDITGMGPSNTSYTVKRVIGLGGDKVSCCSDDGKVIVNGTPQDEPWVFEDLAFEPGSMDCATTPVSSRCFGEVVVPSNNLLVMGDHRSQSADSIIACRGTPPDRAVSGCARFVDESRLIGPVVFRLWPISTFGTID